VPDAYTGRIALEPLEPGKYELTITVTDHLVKRTVSRRAAFTVVEP
jgi:hypothetical protein